MSEQTIIRDIVAGNTALFGTLVERYQNMALTIAFRLTGNMQDAEDIVQNAFVKAFHNLHRFQQKSKFSTWLFRIVYNTTLNAISKKTIKKQYFDYQCIAEEESSFTWDHITEMENEEKKKIINQALVQLHPSETLVISLYYWEDYSVKEVSEASGLSIENVKIKLHRGRKNLEKLLGNYFKIS
jgi:RNA polymerase sigma-70 factor (ECF subfamily)